MSRAWRRRRRMDPPPAAVVAAAAVGVAFVVVPFAGLLARVPWSDLGTTLGGRETRQALALSLWSSAVATVVAMLVGVPLAWVIARTRGPARTALRVVATLPLVVPPVVGGIALLAAFGRRGVVGEWLAGTAGVRLPFTPAGVVLAQVFVALPFVVLAAEGGLRALDRRYEDAAATLGASAWTTLWRVTLPLAAPALGAAAVLAWARALGEFGATITFAGNVPGRTQTLPLAAFLAVEQGDIDRALALSFVLLALSAAVLLALRDRWLPGVRR